MTITQLLLLSIAGLSVMLSADMLRASITHRRNAQDDLQPLWRQVGTFGRWHGSTASHERAPYSQGSIKGILILVLFVIGAVVFKVAWDETHPTVRSAYGRAYERCVADQHISRWQVDEVRRCIAEHPF